MTAPIKSAAAGALLVIVLLAGGAASAAALPDDANTTCPVMTKEKVDPDLYVDYKGQRVYVCCTKCKKRFSQNPEKYLALMKSPDDKITSTVKAVPSPVK